MRSHVAVKTLMFILQLDNFTCFSAAISIIEATKIPHLSKENWNPFLKFYVLVWGHVGVDHLSHSVFKNTLNTLIKASLNFKFCSQMGILQKHDCCKYVKIL